MNYDAPLLVCVLIDLNKALYLYAAPWDATSASIITQPPCHALYTYIHAL